MFTSDHLALGKQLEVWVFSILHMHFVQSLLKKYSAPMLLLSHFSRVQLFATPWMIVFQAPPSMGFSRQEYWSGVPLPSPASF